MERIMAVVSSERKYADRLCNYVNRKGDLIYTAVAFEDMESCIGFGRNHRVEMILADREIIYGNGAFSGRDLQSARTIVLDDSSAYSASPGPHTENGTLVLRKYQPAEQLIRGIIERCPETEIRKKIPHAGKPARIIGVYSPAGANARNEFSIALSRHLNTLCRTLYLDLSEFSGFAALTGEPRENGLSDLLYCQKEGTLTAARINAVIRSFEGIDHIPPMRFADDRNAVCGEDYVKLLHTVFGCTPYEAAVVNMQNFAGEVSEIMDVCETVYVPYHRDTISEMQIAEFDEYLLTLERQPASSGIVRVPLPSVSHPIPMGTYIDSLMYGPVGDLVRELEQG